MNQLHDFNPGIAPSGLFWTVRVPGDAFDIGRRRARLRLDDLEVVDSFTFLGPNEVPAEVDLDVEWRATGPVRRLRPQSDDPTDPTAFRADFRNAVATGDFRGHANGFSFRARNATSEPIFAEMGRERNGVFLHAGWGDDDADGGDDDDDDDLRAAPRR